MEQAEIDRVRRALRQRPKPPWRVLWQYRPAQQVGTGSTERWSRRRTQLQAGWKLLWTERLRRDLAPIYQLATCRRGRHRDAYLVADDLVGGLLGDDYPEVAICELCGRAIQWPNGRPTVAGPGRDPLTLLICGGIPGQLGSRLWGCSFVAGWARRAEPGSWWSARSAARTNDLDAGEGCRRIKQRWSS